MGGFYGGLGGAFSGYLRHELLSASMSENLVAQGGGDAATYNGGTLKEINIRNHRKLTRYNRAIRPSYFFEEAIIGGAIVKPIRGALSVIGGLFGRSAAKAGLNLIPEGKFANHLFKGAGKLADNPANRSLIQNLANSKALGVDAFGKSWHMGLDGAGKSIYTYTQNGIVKGAGYATMTAEQMILKYGLR